MEPLTVSRTAQVTLLSDSRALKQWLERAAERRQNMADSSR
jgi:hypothetical protein